MIDLNVKLALVAAIAWMATRRVTPANAAWAHRLWVAVAMSPLLSLDCVRLTSLARVRRRVVEVVTSASADWAFR